MGIASQPGTGVPIVSVEAGFGITVAGKADKAVRTDSTGGVPAGSEQADRFKIKRIAAMSRINISIALFCKEMQLALSKHYNVLTLPATRAV